MKKNKLSFLFVVILFVSLVSCTFGPQPKADPDSEKKQDRPIVEVVSLTSQAKAQSKNVYEANKSFLVGTSTDAVLIKNTITQFNELTNTYAQNPQAWSAVRSTIRYTGLQDAVSFKEAVSERDYQLRKTGLNLVAAILSLSNDECKDTVDFLTGEKIVVKQPTAVYESGVFKNKGYQENIMTYTDIAEGTKRVFTLKYPDYYQWENMDSGEKDCTVNLSTGSSGTGVAVNLTVLASNGGKVESGVEVDYSLGGQSFSFTTKVVSTESNPTISVSLVRKDAKFLISSLLSSSIRYDKKTGQGSFSVREPGEYILTVKATPTAKTDTYRESKQVFTVKMTDPIDAVNKKVEDDIIYAGLTVLGTLVVDELDLNNNLHALSRYKTIEPELYNFMRREYSIKNNDYVYFVNDTLTPMAILDAVNTIEDILQTLSARKTTGRLYSTIFKNTTVDTGLKCDELEQAARTIVKINGIINSDDNKYPEINETTIALLMDDSTLTEDERQLAVKLCNLFCSLDNVAGLLTDVNIVNGINRLIDDLKTAVAFKDVVYVITEKDGEVTSYYSDVLINSLKISADSILASFGKTREEVLKEIDLDLLDTEYYNIDNVYNSIVEEYVKALTKKGLSIIL